MPLIHTRDFRVRYYECDAYGHLNNANYLRFMQETAFDASAAAGYGLERYAQMGRIWWIRETGIEYLRPFVYNDAIQVKTWVADFHHVTSQRDYALYNAATGELGARGYTVWAFLDSATGKPAPIPGEMATTFFPEGLPGAWPRRKPFPKAPPPPPGVFTSRHMVTWRQIDSQKHVNNAVYLEFIEESGMQVVGAHGWPMQRMTAEGRAILLREMRIQYRLPAVLGDELEVDTWAFNVRRSSALRHYVIRRRHAGEVLAEAQALGVWVDLSSGRPARFPETFLEDFSPNLVLE